MILFVESQGSKKRRIGAILAMLMLLASLSFLMNDYRLSVSPPGDIELEKSWARSGVMPDIMISGIEVQPLVPLAGEPFALNVFCQNIGVVRTGSYGVDVTVRDRDGKEVFTGQAARKKALDPGQTGAAFSALVTLGPVPDRYTVSVVVKPESFEDSNPANNRSSKVIDVL